MTAIDFPSLRSLLYAPADKARALDKIGSLGCDAAIIDLEDSVAPEAKGEARRAAIAFLRSSRSGKPLLLRLNHLETPWGADDLAAAARALSTMSSLSALVLPKVEDARDITRAAGILDDAGAHRTPILAMIESPLALFNLRDIARDAPGRLRGFIAGTNDLAKATGISPAFGRRLLEPLLLQIVCAARAFGLAAFDGVMNRIDDEAALRDECVQGRALGFDGKTLIHPSQIDAANAVFSPSSAELAEAEAIVAAFARAENFGKGAIRLHGAMVERLHLEQAETMLARAARLRPSAERR
jgi:citrate lyase subunit beta/citryl-CoA lyase